MISVKIQVVGVEPCDEDVGGWNLAVWVPDAQSARLLAAHLDKEITLRLPYDDPRPATIFEVVEVEK